MYYNVIELKIHIYIPICIFFIITKRLENVKDNEGNLISSSSKFFKCEKKCDMEVTLLPFLFTKIKYKNHKKKKQWRNSLTFISFLAHEMCLEREFL